MKWTIAFLVVIGIAAALCAAFLVASVRAGTLERRPVQEVSRTEQVILVATRALPAMSVLDATAVKKQTVPAGEAPLDAEMNLTRVVGKVLLAPVVEGQVFTKRSFADGASGVHVAAALEEGSRAMSVFLSAESGIEQLLYPGCVVDVVASFRMPMGRGGQSGEIVSTTLLQHVQVLALGPRTVVSDDEERGLLGPTSDARSKRMVTLMVDAKQAETLQLAAAHGEVTLAMRNPLDRTEEKSDGVRLSEVSDRFSDGLAALAGDDRPAARKGPVWTTTVLRGREPQETVTFPLGEAQLDK